MVNSEEMEALAYDHSRIDNLAQLNAWGAPWYRCWGEISTLEERWPITEIEKMVNERSGHPDFCENVTVRFPEKGWFKDLLAKTRPGFFEVQKISLVITDMTNYMSHDVKAMFSELTEVEEQDRKSAIGIMREAVDAITLYTPDRLDAKGEELFSRSRNMLLSTLKIQLASILEKEDQEAEAEELFPGILNPESFLDSESIAAQITDIVELAQESVEYVNEQSVFGSDEIKEEAVSPEEIEASLSHRSKDPQKNDSNPKFHLYEAYELSLKGGDSEKVIEHTERAFDLIDEFIDSEGECDHDKLQLVAKEFSEIKYFDYHSMIMDRLADNFRSLKRVDLARKVLMLSYAVEQLRDTGFPGYRKGTDEMFYRKSLALCLIELGKYDEAQENLLRAFELAKIYSKPTDITGRAVTDKYVTNYGLYLWLACHYKGDTEEAENCWKEISAAENFDENFEFFIHEFFPSLNYKWLALLLDKYLLDQDDKDKAQEAALGIKKLLSGESERDQMPQRMERMLAKYRTGGGVDQKVEEADEIPEEMKKFLSFLESNEHFELRRLLK